MGSQPRSKTRAARCSTGPVFGLASEECRTVARRQRGLGALGTEQKPEARVPWEPPTLSLHPGATQLVLRLAGVLLRRERRSPRVRRPKPEAIDVLVVMATIQPTLTV